MKKVFLFLLTVGMTFSLTACNNGNEQPSVSVSVSEPAEITESVSTEKENVTSEESLINDFKTAQDLWFKLEGAIDSDYEDMKTADYEGYEYEFYRITEPGFGSYQEIIDLMSPYIDKTFVENTLSADQKYREFEDGLYICPAGRGDDMTISWVEFSAETDGSTGKVIVTIHRQDYFTDLDDWYETGAIDTYEYPFTISDGHAVFTKMDYLCGSCPEEKPYEGHDAETLEKALIGLLTGKWIFEDESSYYEIKEDGTYSYYTALGLAESGVIVSSRSNDGSYMMSGEDIRNTVFILDEDANGDPVLLFDAGSSVFTKEQ